MLRALFYADMAELADALVSGTSEGSLVQVQVLLSAPNQSVNFDTKIALRFGGLFLRLCPETVHSCGFRAFSISAIDSAAAPYSPLWHSYPPSAPKSRRS